ncbi:ribonuclease HII [Candidatus Woesearchaeota archaeon]|nr:ribonuclease HII [Candidatus Woesearchaeota archaeon]
MIICGVEEAGRGPVIGPMVMCGLAVDENKLQRLKDIGVKDSKLLSPHERNHLFDKILELADSCEITVIPPEEIDRAVGREEDINLNWLEARKTADMINKISPDKVYLDCPSPNCEKYKEYIKKLLKNKAPEIIAEHKADVNYPIVGAASIIAKVTRDKEIDALKKRFKVDFGSGYPADPFTAQFLKENYAKYPFFRKSWSCYKDAAAQKNQKKLFEFRG